MHVFVLPFGVINDDRLRLVYKLTLSEELSCIVDEIRIRLVTGRPTSVLDPMTVAARHHAAPHHIRASENFRAIIKFQADDVCCNLYTHVSTVL